MNAMLGLRVSIYVVYVPFYPYNKANYVDTCAICKYMKTNSYKGLTSRILLPSPSPFLSFYGTLEIATSRQNFGRSSGKMLQMSRFEVQL